MMSDIERKLREREDRRDRVPWPLIGGLLLIAAAILFSHYAGGGR